MDDFHRLREDRFALAKVRRDALAYCIDCHNPMLATEEGLQFCPYERADTTMAPSYDQHEKVKRALQLQEEARRPKAPVLSLVGSARRRRERKRRPTLSEPPSLIASPSRTRGGTT